MEPLPPLSLRGLTRALWSDLRRSFAVLFVYEAVFKLLSGLILLPALVTLLFHLVRHEGRTALTNHDILGFLLSPLGVLYAYLLGLKILSFAMLEYAGAMALAAMKQTGGWHGVRYALIALATRTTRTLMLAGLVLALLALALAPFFAAAAVAYRLILGGQDVNYYLAERPPPYYAACAIAGLLFLSAIGLTAWLFVRWAFALPILLFEKVRPWGALRESAARTRGVRGRLAGLLLGWSLAGLVVQALVVALFKFSAGGVLTAIGRRPSVIVVEVAVLLAVKLLLLAFVSGLVVVGLSLLLLRLYVERSVRLGLIDRAHWADRLEEVPRKPRRLLLRLEWGIAAFIVVVAAFYLLLTLPFGLRDGTKVSAHRGYSRRAPENSLAAFREAIEAGADYLELDVQLTADGEVVVLHDEDLMRMLGDPRRVSAVDLDQLQELPFGGKRGKWPGYDNERVPTLREVIELARNAGCKLNVELKFSERKDAYKSLRLSRKVAELIYGEKFSEECFVSSLHLPGVREAKRHNRFLRTAAIVTVAVGDVSKLDVNILSVRNDLVNEALLRKARQLGKEVHVWDVKTRRDMRRLIEMGVDNIITDELETFLEVRAEREKLGDTQRLLLTCRYLLD